MSEPQDSALAMLLDDMPSPVFLLRKDAPVIEWVNQAALEWFEKSKRSIIGQMFTEFFYPNDALVSTHKRCVKHQAPVSLHDHVLIRRSKAEQRAHLWFYPSALGIGLVVQFSGTQAEPPSSDAEAMSAMGHMLAHEIKNPLAGINGAAQLLRDDIRTDEGLALIDLIGSEIDRISRLTDRMQSLGNIDPENSGEVNIHEVLRQARRVIQTSNEKNITFTEVYDPSLPPIVGDVDSLMQAILNLIKNAYEALTSGHILDNMSETGRGGEIILETSYRSGARRRVVDSTGKEHALPIEIRIIDNGPGIPDALRDQIFQPFITKKPGGQGLGLALVTKVISAHNGLVDVSSRPGRTVFSILLPTPNEVAHDI